MKKIVTLLSVLAVFLLSGCASLSPDPHPGKLERVGVLLVKECNQASNCSPYTLLESDLQKPEVALSGSVDARLEGRLIAVLGIEEGVENGLQLIRVEKTRAITDMDYQSFLGEAVTDYTQQEYGCVSFWDQAYAWRLEGRQPVLMATLTHPDSAVNGRLELEYDGLNGALRVADLQPDTADPCQIR